MKQAVLWLLLFTLNPATGNCQPPTVVATAYCLKGQTTSGPTTSQVHATGGCIALSRKLAQDLGLKCGPGQFDYRFGTVIEVIGLGRFVFADLMPPRWRHYRVDIYQPTRQHCRAFGVQRRQVRIWRHHELTAPHLD